MRTVVGCVVVLCVGACSAAPPLSVAVIRDCVTPDSGIAAPVDSAAYAVSARRCLAARGH